MITHKIGNRSYKLANGAIAQGLVNRVYRLVGRKEVKHVFPGENSKSDLDMLFEGLKHVYTSDAKNPWYSKLKNAASMPNWVLRYEKTIAKLLLGVFCMIAAPYALQYALVSQFILEDMIIAFVATIFVAALASIFLAQLFSGAAHVKVKETPQVKHYIDQHYGELLDQLKNADEQKHIELLEQVSDNVDKLLKNRGVLERLIRVFGASYEISTTSIAFKGAALVALGISAVGFMNIIPMSPLVALTSGILSVLSFISGKLTEVSRVEYTPNVKIRSAVNSKDIGSRAEEGNDYSNNNAHKSKYYNNHKWGDFRDHRRVGREVREVREVRKVSSETQYVIDLTGSDTPQGSGFAPM